MNDRKIIPFITKPALTAILFFIVGILCVFIARHRPLGDFGNYYYGSRLYLDQKFTSEMYNSIHYFNSEVAAYGQTNFFGNYIPVPPITTLVYLPFCFFEALAAKIIFNVMGLLLFCISIYRLLNFIKDPLPVILLILPFVLFYPLLNNMVQGQSYLFIVSFLIEAFLFSEKRKIIIPSLLIAFCVSLKLFPMFLLIYFLLRRNFKVIMWSSVFTCILFFLPALFIGLETVNYYFIHVLPRLYNNDVVGTYYPGNQSIYTALLNLFSYDGLNNPQPLINNKFLLVLFDSCFTAFILCVSLASSKEKPLVIFSVVILAGLLISKYSTSYSLILLLPIAIVICIYKNQGVKILLLLLLCFAVSVPVTQFFQMPFFIKYPRLIALLIVFFGFALRSLVNFKTDLLMAVILFALIFAWKYSSFPINKTNYFSVQNTNGILYDLQIRNDSLMLISTNGMSDSRETFALKGKAVNSLDLSLKKTSLFYKNNLISASPDNKLKPFIYNDTSVVFMSDQNQAVGFYKLRWMSLHE